MSVSSTPALNQFLGEVSDVLLLCLLSPRNFHTRLSAVLFEITELTRFHSRSLGEPRLRV